MHPLILLDTDLNTDCGDAGAIALLHALADLGEAGIVGIGVSVSNPDTPFAAFSINEYYGRPGIPVGRYAGVPLIEPEGHAFVTALRKMCVNPPAEPFPSTTEVYRRALAGSPDGAVTVVAIGFHRPLQLLLQSPGDEVSPLDGISLVRAKVKQLVVMGGQYPDSRTVGSGAEYNFWRDPSSVHFVCAHWPTQIVFTGYELGNTIYAGKSLSTATPRENPVRAAYELFSHDDGYQYQNGRQAWDETAIWYAVRGAEHEGVRYFEEVHGLNRVDGETGANAFTAGSGPHAYLLKTQEDEVYSRLIDELQCRPPAEPPGASR